jgi:2-iminobutanoate/2-iminopropanoate deaminase
VADEVEAMSTPIGPYSPIVRSGDLLFTSGQLGVLPGADGAPALVEGGVAAQLAQALANADALLVSEGATRDDVVKATIFVGDLSAFGAINDVWSAFFGSHRPARSTVGVAALPLGAAVEVELVARCRG